MTGTTLTNQGKPDTQQYVLGRGHLYFDLFIEGTDAPSYRQRHLGNASAFSLTSEEEIIEHFSSRAGLKKTDASATLTKALKGSMTLEELSAENVALFTSANIDVDVATPTFTDKPVFIPANSAGYYVQLWDAAVDDTPGPAVVQGGDPVTGLDSGSAFTLKDSLLATLTAGTDYEIDLERGQLYIPVGGALDQIGDEWCYFSATALAGTRKNVKFLDRTVVRGALTFVGENAVSGLKRILRLHKVKMQASGELSMVGNEFASMAVEFTAEENSSFSTSPVGTLHYFEA